jgi:hypothetical protein
VPVISRSDTTSFLKTLYLIIEIRDDIQCGIRCDRSKQVYAVNQFTINLPYRRVDGIQTP